MNVTKPDRDTTIQQLRKCIEAILPFAIRYAHGRHSTAPSIVREVVQTLRELFPDFKLKPDPVIKPPEDWMLKQPLVQRDDYLDDLFKEVKDEIKAKGIQENRKERNKTVA